MVPMGSLFSRALMPAAGKPTLRWIVVTAFVVAIAWLTTAHADDILDRNVNFQIPASPLGSALLEFSSQSGVRVAAADADVARLNTGGVNGTYPIRTALSLLLGGTGLEFLPVGAETVAIRTAATRPGASTLANAGEPEAATSMAAAKPGQPDVTILSPRPPTDQELAGDSVYQFIVHHATVHYQTTGTSGNLAHWRGGRQSICVQTLGIDPGGNEYVSARLRALAMYVGAPVQSKPECEDNVRIIFTNDPQKLMAGVTEWASRYFRLRYPAIKRLIQYTGDHAIQGWYFTTAGDSRALTSDPGVGVKVSLQPVWPQIIASGLRDTGDMSGIGGVMLIVDTRKVASYQIGMIADYLSMLTLSVAQSPDNCDPLPSILDVFSTSCGARERPTAITAGDLAFLKALYANDTGFGPSLSRYEIKDNMMRQFKGRGIPVSAP